MAGRSNMRTISLWITSAVLAALYLMAGGSKLAGAEMHIEGFARWAYPQWFRLLVGTVEVMAAVLLLIPRVAFVGASLIVVLMAGATYTHLFRATGEEGSAAVTIVLLALAAIVAYARRPVTRRRSHASRGVVTRERHGRLG